MGDDAADLGLAPDVTVISIHVPRMGDDHCGRKRDGVQRYFYPRPPYGGRPTNRFLSMFQKINFYPRPPYGGRRIYFIAITPQIAFLSTSPVWGTTFKVAIFKKRIKISIHVPRMGDDNLVKGFITIKHKFLSTSPVWGTTLKLHLSTIESHISIHVPRMGDDAGIWRRQWCNV